MRAIVVGAGMKLLADALVGLKLQGTVVDNHGPVEETGDPFAR